MRFERVLRAFAMTAVVAVLLAVTSPLAARAAGVADSLTLYGADVQSYPTVTVRVGLPTALVGTAGTPPTFSVAENGKPAEVLAAKAETTSRKVQVALLIDVSGSMKGQPLTNAKAAAKRFVTEMSGKADVAVVAFSSSAQVVSGYSPDTAALVAAIDALATGGETAVYDAVVAGTKLASSPSALRAFVLLSDGGDTTSVSTLDQAVKAVQASQIPVLAVSLESPEFNQQSLQTLAGQSGGRLMSVSDSGQLPTYFAQLAQEISSVYLVAYRSDKPTTKNLDLDVTAKTANGTATLATTIENPLYVQTVELGSAVFSMPTANPLLLVGAIALAFASVGLLVAGILLSLRSRNVKTLSQMRFYDQLKGDQSVPGDPQSGSGMKARIVDAVGVVAGRGGFTKVIARKLERAGMPLRPAEWIAGHITIVVVVGFLTQFLLGRAWLGLLAVLLASAVPLLLLDSRGDKRVRAFESQLPDILNLISGGLRSGWGLQQAIGLVVSEGAQPASDEFRRVQVEARLGVPVELALDSMAQRLGSEIFSWVVSAVSIQREVGGNLAQVLDNVAASVRDRDALMRQVAALTAEGRLSMIVLTALPFVVVGGMLVVAPTYLSAAFRSPLGIPIAILALCLLGVGFVWMRAVSRIEY